MCPKHQCVMRECDWFQPLQFNWFRAGMRQIFDWIQQLNDEKGLICWHAVKHTFLWLLVSHIFPAMYWTPFILPTRWASVSVWSVTNVLINECSSRVLKLWSRNHTLERCFWVLIFVCLPAHVSKQYQFIQKQWKMLPAGLYEVCSCVGQLCYWQECIMSTGQRAPVCAMN